MMLSEKWNVFYAILEKELRRTFRVWPQSLLPSVVTTTLYFLIFGHVIGRRIGSMSGHDYVSFIAPGLIMLSVITNSYAAAVSGFFSAKFMRNIEELLVTPTSNVLILLGFMGAGVSRAVVVGVLVTLVAIFFTHIALHSVLIVFVVALLAASIFSLGGVLNALYAKRFDDISIIPTFVLTPLTYLGGVFYSVKLLPHFWQTVSFANPILYIVEAFRFGFLGTQGASWGVYFAFFIMLIFLVALFSTALILMKKGIGLKT